MNSICVDQAFAGNRLLSTFAARGPRPDRARLDRRRSRTELARAPSRRGRRGEPVPVRVDDDLDVRGALRRPLGRSRIDRPRRRRRGNHQLRPRARLLQRRRPGRRARSASADPGPRRGQEALDLRREHFLPLLRLSALAGDAVGGVQCVPFDRATGRAVAAARPGPRRRHDRAHAGRAWRGCSASSGPRSTR